MLRTQEKSQRIKVTPPLRKRTVYLKSQVSAGSQLLLYDRRSVTRKQCRLPHESYR